MFQDEFPNSDALMSPVQKPEDPEEQLKKYLKTLPLNERRKYLAGMRGEPPGAQPPIQQENMPMFHAAQQGFLGYMGPVAQGQMAQQSMKGTMDDIAVENARRVAMSREMRRMAHEQELERMKQETERMKINALISRLQQQQGQGGGWSNPAEGLFIR